MEEMKINYQQHPQGLLESQKTPPRHPSISPNRRIAGIRYFLFPYISTSVLDFYLLFFSKICTNIAWRYICNTWIIPFASFSARRTVVMGIEQEESARERALCQLTECF